MRRIGLACDVVIVAVALAALCAGLTTPFLSSASRGAPEPARAPVIESIGAGARPVPATPAGHHVWARM